MSVREIHYFQAGEKKAERVTKAGEEEEDNLWTMIRRCEAAVRARVSFTRVRRTIGYQLRERRKERSTVKKESQQIDYFKQGRQEGDRTY